MEGDEVLDDEVTGTVDIDETLVVLGAADSDGVELTTEIVLVAVGV